MQADATALATGRYPWEMRIIGRYTNGDTATNVYNGHAEIVNLNASNFGDNWMPRELDRLVPQSGGVLLARGDGITAWFTSGGGPFTKSCGTVWHDDARTRRRFDLSPHRQVRQQVQLLVNGLVDVARGSRSLRKRHNAAVGINSPR